MKIGYDAKRAAFNYTGLGNYSRYIIKNIANLHTNEIVLYTPKKSENREYRELFVDDKVSQSTPQSLLGRKIPALWRSFFIVKQIRKAKIDLYHGLSNELPFGIRCSKAKSIVTIHDLIFLELPHCYRSLDRFIYNIKAKYACRKADHILAISECTKRDILKYYHIDPAKISVVYQGCSPMFRVTQSEELKKEIREIYNLPKRFILNVGTLEERKNLFLIVKSLLQLPVDVHIVAVGRRTDYSDMVLEYARIHGLSKRVHLLHKVKYEHLPALYQIADLFAYPSYYEGFGIPIIEAISSQKAVIAATGSCLEEAGGGGAIYVNPDSEDEFADAAKRLLESEELRAELVRKGNEHIQKFEDRKQAVILNDLYMKLSDDCLR